MTTLISPDDTWTLWALIIAGTGLSIWLEQNYRWAAKLSGPVMALGMAIALSNLHVVPTESKAYDFVGDYLVPLAIPLLLFRANFLRIIRATGWTFVAFHIAAVGTILGAILATFLLRGRLPDIENAAGIMTGSYVGGAINFFALKETFGASANITNPLLVADNVVMAALFLGLLAISSSQFFLRRYPHPHSLGTDADAAKVAAEHWQRKGVGLMDLAKSLAFAFAVVGVAGLLGRLLHWSWPSAENSGIALQTVRELVTNKFVLITSVALVGATLLQRPMARINGPEELGSYMLYLFLFVIGLPADLVTVISTVPLFFVFCAIMAGVNLLVTLLVGRLFRFNLEDLLISSNATTGGPASAAAMCISKGWAEMVLPAILVGIWGYVVGTPLGVLVTRLLEAWR